MEIFTKDHTLMENQMDMGNTFGQTEATIKEISQMGSEMERAYGKKIRAKVINMKDNMLMIKRMDLGFLLGLVEIAILEIIRQI